MSRRRLFAYLALFLGICPAFGCVGLSAQLLNVIVGQKVKADYPHLKKQRVALICVANHQGYGPDYAMQMLAQLVGQRLQRNVKDIDLIPQREVENVYAGEGQTSTYVELGKLLKADQVVVVEVSAYGLQDGQTLYRGQAEYTTRVYEMESGALRFSRGPVEIVFPEYGKPVADTSEREFEKTFLVELSYRIARYFYDYAHEESFGRDAIAFH